MLTQAPLQAQGGTTVLADQAINEHFPETRVGYRGLLTPLQPAG